MRLFAQLLPLLLQAGPQAGPFSPDPDAGTVLIPIVGAIGVFFLHDAEESALARSQQTVKFDIGAAMDGRTVDIGLFVPKDFIILARHNQAFALSNDIVSQGQELGLRYFFWNKFFVEGGFFHAIRREKAYIAFPRNSGPGYNVSQYWTERYRNFGSYSGLGVETQFRNFSIGAMSLLYSGWKSWKLGPASIAGLPDDQQRQLTERNQECRDAYRAKWETSFIIGTGF